MNETNKGTLLNFQHSFRISCSSSTLNFLKILKVKQNKGDLRRCHNWLQTTLPTRPTVHISYWFMCHTLSDKSPAKGLTREYITMTNKMKPQCKDSALSECPVFGHNCNSTDKNSSTYHDTTILSSLDFYCRFLHRRSCQEAFSEITENKAIKRTLYAYYPMGTRAHYLRIKGHVWSWPLTYV